MMMVNGEDRDLGGGDGDVFEVRPALRTWWRKTTKKKSEHKACMSIFEPGNSKHKSRIYSCTSVVPTKKFHGAESL